MGKTMTVTGVAGSYTVTEIDGRSATEVFERYLGLPYRTSAFAVENICEFPLTVERGGLTMARIPYAWTPEGALEFDVAMRLGDTVRLSYGLPQQVFSQVFDDVGAFRAFEPQAMLMVICMNRMMFLKERERVETDAYRAVVPQAAFLHGHSGRVAAYSREIARRAGYSERRQNEILIMGLLHDVGKIGVSDAVINKPGRLTDEEFEQIKRHPGMGARILGAIREMPKLATGAHWHHERYDGRGYPDGLSGEDIPEEARIIGVADAYDAMTSNRSYRRSMDQAQVREQIMKGRGSQFDPRFADIMLQMIDDDKDYRMREQARDGADQAPAGSDKGAGADR